MSADFEALFHQTYEPLVRYLYRMVGDPDLAADLAQEAFVRLWERRPRDEHLRAWLFRVATNLVRDLARVEGRRVELVHEQLTRVPLSDPPARPDEAAEAAERRAQVQRALATLSERERAVLLMREEGFSYKEMAEALGLSVNTIPTVLARGLEKLERALARSEA